MYSEEQSWSQEKERKKRNAKGTNSRREHRKGRKAKSERKLWEKRCVKRKGTYPVGCLIGSRAIGICTLWAKWSNLEQTADISLEVEFDINSQTYACLKKIRKEKKRFEQKKRGNIKYKKITNEKERENKLEQSEEGTKKKEEEKRKEKNKIK